MLSFLCGQNKRLGFEVVVTVERLGWVGAELLALSSRAGWRRGIRCCWKSCGDWRVAQQRSSRADIQIFRYPGLPRTGQQPGRHAAGLACWTFNHKSIQKVKLNLVIHYSMDLRDAFIPDSAKLLTGLMPWQVTNACSTLIQSFDDSGSNLLCKTLRGSEARTGQKQKLTVSPTIKNLSAVAITWTRNLLVIALSNNNNLD